MGAADSRREPAVPGGSEDLAKVTLQTEELEQVRFFSPASFAEVLTDRLSRRIAAAVHALSVGDTTYLEPLTQPTNV
jgi:hypothetical protein